MGLGKYIKKHFPYKYDILNTTFLAFSLFLLEELIEGEFKCPEDVSLTFIYSLVFIIFSCLILLLLGCYFYDNESPWVCCSLGCWKKIRPAFLWLFILLADGRYFTCLLKTSGQESLSLRPKSQMFGFVGIFLFISFSLGFQCYKKLMGKWYPDKYENYLAKALEEFIREKAKKAQEAFVVELADDYFRKNSDKTFNPNDQNWMEELETMVRDAKNHSSEKFKIMIKKEKRREKKETNETSLHDQDFQSQDQQVEINEMQQNQPTIAATENTEDSMLVENEQLKLETQIREF